MGIEAAEGVDGIDGGDIHMGTGIREHADGENSQDRHFADKRHAQDGRGDLDVEEGQDRDADDHDQRQDRPRHVDANPLLDVEIGEIGEAAGERGLEDRIGDHRAEAEAHAELAPQPMADEGIEAADGSDLARHRRIAHREDQQDDGGDQEGGRGPDAVAVADGDGNVEQHGGDRRRAGHRQEQHADESDGLGVKLVEIAAVGDVIAELARSSTTGWLGCASFHCRFSSPL